MTLDYKIHWVDDSPDFAESVRDTILEHFENAEINIQATIVEDGDNLEEVAFSDALDLFVLDYNLDGRNGDELIEVLRSRGELTEIVFYSQDENVYQQVIAFEGVHACIRTDAQEKIEHVISRFIDRSKNVAVMRGMIISEAIDLENKLTEIILELFGDKGDLFQRKILNKPLLDFEKKRAFLQSVLKDKITEAKQANPVDQPYLDTLERLKDSLTELKREIVDQRNILAHSQKTFEEGILRLRPLGAGSPIIFNNNWINTTRQNIKKHLKNLHEIRNILLAE